MKCDRCDKEIREAGVMPTLELKTLGLYPTINMSLGGYETVLTANSAAANVDIASTAVTINDGQSGANPNPWLIPTSLHRLPGRPINAYLNIISVAAKLRINGGAPTLFNVMLLWEDNGARRHVIASYNGVAQDGTLQGIALPLIIAQPMAEKPQDIGRWVLRGSYTLGASTDIELRVFANYSIVYGAPNT